MKKGERSVSLLAQRLAKDRDGPVARYLNRRLSIPLSLWLASNTRLTPNQMSFLSFGIATIAAALFAGGKRAGLAAGGILAQVSSVLDGCDGELARLRGASSPYGGWLDSVLDRWADGLIIAGMAAAGWRLYGTALPWWLGLLALVGAMGVSYSESRYQAAFGRPLPPKGHLPAKRDVRLLLVMLGGLTGQIVPALVLIAGLSIAEVLRRLWVYRPEK